MNKNGQYHKCTRGHELIALEGHPIVDGLPICPTCLFRMYCNLMHTSMQLTNRVDTLLNEMNKSVAIPGKQIRGTNSAIYKIDEGVPNGFKPSVWPRGQTSSIQYLDDSPYQPVSVASTSAKEQAIMEASLVTVGEQTPADEGTLLVATLLVKYLSPSTMYSCKGVVKFGHDSNGNLMINDGSNFKIFIENPTSPDLKMSLETRLPVNDFIAALDKHLIMHYNIVKAEFAKN